MINNETSLNEINEINKINEIKVEKLKFILVSSFILGLNVLFVFYFIVYCKTI